MKSVCGNIKNRFTVAEIGEDFVVTDNTTGMQFVDAINSPNQGEGAWAFTWKEAMTKCQSKTVGEGATGAQVLQCPPPVCPEPQSKYEPYNDLFCRYKSSAVDAEGNCKAPVCGSNNYAELQKRVSTNGTETVILNPEEEDFWGKCYYSGSSCNAQTNADSEVTQCESLGTDLKCSSGYTKVDAVTYGSCTGKLCLKNCPSGYTLEKRYNGLLIYYVCTKSVCSSNQNCITINGECDTAELGATKKACPANTTEQGGKCVSNEAVGYNIYSSISSEDAEEAECDGGSCLKNDVEEIPCPAGTWDINNNGICEYYNCGVYANGGGIDRWNHELPSDFANYSGYLVWADATSANPSSTTPRCYGSYDGPSLLSDLEFHNEATCCCNKTIYRLVQNKTSLNTYNHYPLKYTTSYNPNGTPSQVENWTCQQAKYCSDYGYTKGPDGNCYKCQSGNLSFDGGEVRCYDPCPAGSELHDGKCYSCSEAGYFVVKEGGEYVCKKSCPSGAYQGWEGGELKCYTDIVDKVKVCDTDSGWINDPNDEGKCRKLQVSNGAYVSVKCAEATSNNNLLDNNLQGRTCDESNPNSYDCHCKKDRCEDSGTLWRLPVQ